jgi:Bacterial regulatory proteins, lacI family
MAAGMKDVATLAGVAVGTVSNVLNHPDLVRPQTRARVEAAMEQLGFIPNASARPPTQATSPARPRPLSKLASRPSQAPRPPRPSAPTICWPSDCRGG